jgi:hypothetical protein
MKSIGKEIEKKIERESWVEPIEKRGLSTRRIDPPSDGEDFPIVK